MGKNHAEEKKDENPLAPVIEGLKKVYFDRILPLEKAYSFDQFHSPSLMGTDFDAQPMVLLSGQYSTGKTTFISYLLEREFPGAHIGDEPTTDRFVAVMHGPERQIPGNVLALAEDKPFRSLSKFGMAFLNKFEGAQCISPILENVMFIDTPGVLSGEKQRGRAYDFPSIVEWFANKVDRILLLFDAGKLDVSDEFEQVILCLKEHPEKIRVILNKSDIPKQQLMRVYGALMWSLGKIIKSPEVVRVYVGSFWDRPIENDDVRDFLERERRELLAELRSLPRGNCLFKVNLLVKRARMVKVHVLILHHLHKKFGVFGAGRVQKKILASLPEMFKEVQQKYNLPEGDFPDAVFFHDKLEKFDINKFPKLNKKKIADLEQSLATDIPKLISLVPGADAKLSMETGTDGSILNPFDAVNDDVSGAWTVDRSSKLKYDNEFNELALVNNKLSGANAKPIFLRSALPTTVLRKIWALADVDKDGWLDSVEFAVAMHLIEQINSGAIEEPPAELDMNLCPPSKRHLLKA